MKELIELMVKGLVDKAEAVKINQITGEKTIIFEVEVDAQDIGKIIGKQGRNIKAIRTIVNAAAKSNQKRVVIEVIH